MHFIPRFCAFAALAAIAGTPGIAGADDASAKCPFEAAGGDYDGLVLCVPKGNDRYRLVADGVDWMAWKGDVPVQPPTADDPATGAENTDLTVARVWLGKNQVGTTDSVAGKNGFDRFMTLIGASAARAAQQSAGPDFVADVPMDESGRVQQFAFHPLEPGLLEGRRQNRGEPGPSYLIVRLSGAEALPRVLMCAGGESQDPGVVCFGIFGIAGHRAGVTVGGADRARLFRFTEAILSDLESFALSPTP